MDASVVALKESVEYKMSSLNESISDLTNQVAELNKAISLQSKHQNLAWAISNVKSGHFDYRGGPSLITSTLMAFRKECGYDITGYYLPHRQIAAAFGAPMVHRDQSVQKEFNDVLIDKIHMLTGQKPRVALENEKWFIYYS